MSAVGRTPRVISPTVARRLAIIAQRLAGARPSPDAAGILDLVTHLRSVQLDPTNAVAQSHLLVLWSRVGRYDPARVDDLLWRDHRLFEYRAFIVPTEHYPIYQYRMRTFAAGETAWPRRARAFLKQNAALRRHILAELRRHGALPSGEFEDRAATAWRSTGWTSGRNVSQMLEFLSAKGVIMVAGRRGGQRLWDLAERVLPPWAPRERLSARDVNPRVAEGAVRALGVARVAHLRRGLAQAVAALERDAHLARVQVEGLRGPWYVHADDLPLLDRLAAGE